jgi:hypothetical protein
MKALGAAYREGEVGRAAAAGISPAKKVRLGRCGAATLLGLATAVLLPLLGLLVDLLLGDLDELLGEACEAGTSVVLP